MAANGVAAGIVVTSGTFTQDAAEFASGRNVSLIAGEELHGLIREARATIPTPASTTPAAAPNASVRICPKCGGQWSSAGRRADRTLDRRSTAAAAPACNGTLPV